MRTKITTHIHGLPDPASGPWIMLLHMPYSAARGPAPEVFDRWLLDGPFDTHDELIECYRSHAHIGALVVPITEATDENLERLTADV